MKRGRRKRYHKREIKDIVLSILLEYPASRNDDRYLYLKVVERMNPSAMTRPFFLAYMDDEMPNTETVRRARQFCQAHYDGVQADTDVEALRLLEEESYKEFAIYG